MSFPVKYKNSFKKQLSLARKEERVRSEKRKGRKKEVEGEVGEEIIAHQKRQSTIIPAGTTLCHVHLEASITHDTLSMGNQPRPQRTLGTARALLLLANTHVVNPPEHHLTRDSLRLTYINPRFIKPLAVLKGIHLQLVQRRKAMESNIRYLGNYIVLQVPD